MLGFSQLVNTYAETNEDRLTEFLIGWQQETGDWQQNGDWWELYDGVSMLSRGTDYELERRLTVFGEIIKRQIEQNSLPGLRTLMAFSDCFFLANRHSLKVLTTSAHIMVTTAVTGIPLRMGVARGALVAGVANLTPGGLRRVFAVPFLGKGVVGAHDAESKGLKGLRIALHPSMTDDAEVMESALVVPRAEQTKCCKHEFNYLLPLLTQEEAHGLVPRLVQRVIELAEQYQDDERVFTQYGRTAGALSRMFEDIRKRTRALGTSLPEGWSEAWASLHDLQARQAISDDAAASSADKKK